MGLKRDGQKGRLNWKVWGGNARWG